MSFHRESERSLSFLHVTILSGLAHHCRCCKRPRPGRMMAPSCLLPKAEHCISRHVYRRSHVNEAHSSGPPLPSGSCWRILYFPGGGKKGRILGKTEGTYERNSLLPITRSSAEFPTRTLLLNDSSVKVPPLRFFIVDISCAHSARYCTDLGSDL